jgi:hypothetical protein
MPGVMARDGEIGVEMATGERHLPRKGTALERILVLLQPLVVASRCAFSRGAGVSSASLTSFLARGAAPAGA